MPRYCYQLHTHRSPDQIYRLVDTILATSSDPFVVISHDRTGAPLDAARLNRNGSVLLLLTEGGYADWSHVRRYLEVVGTLREQNVDYDWMVNITGQDYPTRPLHETEAELDACPSDGFVEHFDVESSASPWGPHLAHNRYWFHYRTLRRLGPVAMRRLRPIQAVNRVQPWARLNVSRGLTVGRRADVPYGPDLRCYGGSFHASVRRECAEYAYDVAARRPALVEHYRRVLSPAESYLQTVWLAGDRFAFVDDCKRYFDFSSTTFGHPRTLSLADVEPARASGAHFSRKWDLDRDPDAYEAMDATVLAG